MSGRHSGTPTPPWWKPAEDDRPPDHGPRRVRHHGCRGDRRAPRPRRQVPTDASLSLAQQPLLEPVAKKQRSLRGQAAVVSRSVHASRRVRGGTAKAAQPKPAKVVAGSGHRPDDPGPDRRRAPPGRRARGRPPDDDLPDRLVQRPRQPALRAGRRPREVPRRRRAQRRRRRPHPVLRRRHPRHPGAPARPAERHHGDDRVRRLPRLRVRLPRDRQLDPLRRLEVRVRLRQLLHDPLHARQPAADDPPAARQGRPAASSTCSTCTPRPARAGTP